MRLRQRDHWCDEIEMTRSAVPMSFGSRTRTRSVTLALMRSVLRGLVLGGDDLDGGVGAGVRSVLSGSVTLSRSLSLSLSLSLRV